MGGSCTVQSLVGDVISEGAVQLLVGDVICGRELYSHWLVM